MSILLILLLILLVGLPLVFISWRIRMRLEQEINPRWYWLFNALEFLPGIGEWLGFLVGHLEKPKPGRIGTPYRVRQPPPVRPQPIAIAPKRRQFCSNCRTQLNPTAAFCFNCGSPTDPQGSLST